MQPAEDLDASILAVASPYDFALRDLVAATACVQLASKEDHTVGRLFENADFLPGALVQLLLVQGGESAEDKELSTRLLLIALTAMQNLSFYGNLKTALQFYDANVFKAAVARLSQSEDSKPVSVFLQLATNILLELPTAVHEFFEADFLRLAEFHMASEQVQNSLSWTLRNVVVLSP